MPYSLPLKTENSKLLPGVFDPIRYKYFAMNNKMNRQYIFYI